MATKDTASGNVSASVLVTVLVSLVSGAIYGLMLGTVLRHQYLIAVIAALLAVITATAFRYLIIYRATRSAPLSPGDGPLAMPTVLWTNAIIASIFGGLAAHAVLLEAAPHAAPIVTGAAAGLFGGILSAMLMVAYYSARAEGYSKER
jgi:phosphotransferase system  glucose/maltose/N-acetylglucosamine-specific IIC component